MDFTSQYCPDRRNLEENLWVLSTRLFGLSGRLLKLVGKDHTAFTSTKDECQETRAEIVELKSQLTAHRLAHGC